MLSGSKSPTIKLAASSGPKLSISGIKKSFNEKNPKTDKNGNPIKANDAETTSDDRLKAEKNGSETSVDSKVKKILKNLQKAKNADEKNTDPNAPINSEKDPARIDLANLKNGNSAKDSAERFGFSMPGTSRGGSEAQKANNAQAGGAANPIGGVAGNAGAGGFGGGSSGNGSQQGGNSGPWNGSPPPITGGGNPGGGSPGTGDGTTNPAGIVSREVVEHGSFNDIKYVASSGKQEFFENKYPGQHIEERANDNGTSQYVVHNANDPGHSEPGHDNQNEVNNLDSLNSIDTNSVASLDNQEIEAIQKEPELVPEPIFEESEIQTA